MIKQPDTNRGSSKLLMERCGTRTFDECDLHKFIKDLNQDGIEIVDYLPRGLPAPYIVEGSLKVSPDRLPALFARLDTPKATYWKRLELFPIGTPWPDFWHVFFEVVPNIDH